ncbi:Mediator of RNA polymerase II transcription subunit 6 [Ophidiomyces ophidiicola]|nr:Mediator of RNA polymerase II transcription subunit 6 [Ophidiomyces ophidiicola]KAI2158827.1 Mediator of RNA polymerase II transcription subunit 6 [Ophidiomyces ophidiicola]KAI2196047.1 Mediator of RNA polymerase II transcription subunit 6 [Ophidiomyces ophidiicola]KAI2213092.1 Mediator of RNA polymerase II transcription subunit 6 [Ophidiomyces ophidiicola]KAI2263707.1 Mediator of RNA polymerase II transcription subunit 6 [Ophidiomyces ophidiicola]
MDFSPDVPLEEITWHSPQHVQMMGGFVHSNNILFYFAESPFFDPTSNNASLALQAMHNENLRPFVETREAFEARLKTMQGLEFMVARDPLLESAAANASATVRGEQPKEPSNVWVIRKQMRRKAVGKGGQDDVQILATFFAVGESVFMAPSVWSVVGRRVLSSVTSLSKVLSSASPLLSFSPSYGHSYFSYTPKPLEFPQSAQRNQETTPLPDPQSATKDGLTAKFSSSTSTSRINSPELQDTRNFAEMLSLFTRYGDEYMDDSTLIGEPGSFIFTKTAAPAQKLASGINVPEVKQNIKPGAGIPQLGVVKPDTIVAGPVNLQPEATRSTDERSADKVPLSLKDKVKKKKA